MKNYKPITLEVYSFLFIYKKVQIVYNFCKYKIYGGANEIFKILFKENKK